MLNHSQSFSEDTQEKVELFLSCRNLINLHHSVSSNIKIKIYYYQNDKYNFFDETEVVKNNLNPDFTKTFTLNYYFETTQKLLFQLFHTDNAHEIPIGEVSTTLGSIVGASRQTMKKGLNILHQGKESGKLIIKFEKITNNNNSVSMGFQAQIQQTSGGWLQLLDVFGFFGSDDYVLKLYRITSDFDYVPIYESEIISHTSTPSWRPFDIKVSKLCNSDYFRPVKAQVYSKNNNQDTLVGECQFTLDEMMNQNVKKFNLLNPTSKKHTGTLNVNHFKLTEKANFLDYIQGGVQLNVIVGIDFTASNGDPDLDTSLHSSRLGGGANEYQKAISSVCDILLNYDYDRRVLMFGFGGKPRYPNLRSNIVQHCFPLTGNLQDPWAFDLDGIMNAYNYALQNVELSGPTLFGPMLNEAMKVAQVNKTSGSMEYTILLIITDGEIHDMESTINCLIKSADLPLSVIIVGVGDANFGNMDILDGDEGLYNSEGTKAQRDLVQFVPFRKFQHNAEELAKHVLEEVPDQLVEYMTRVGIKPNAPQPFDLSTLSAQIQNFSQENIQNYPQRSQSQPQGQIQGYNYQGNRQGQSQVYDYRQQIGSQSQVYDPRQQGQSYYVDPSQPLAPVADRNNPDLYSSISVPRYKNLNFEQGEQARSHESGEP